MQLNFQLYCWHRGTEFLCIFFLQLVQQKILFSAEINSQRIERRKGLMFELLFASWFHPHECTDVLQTYFSSFYGTKVNISGALKQAISKQLCI